MNIDDIFNLFKSPEEENETTTQVDMSDHPIVWMGMFKKLIINYKIFIKEFPPKLKKRMKYFALIMKTKSSKY
jgi:hypothetical protein